MENLTVVIYCLIITVLLPFVAKIPVAHAMRQLGNGNKRGYDNALPREQQRRLEGFGARCLAAHKNCFEALTYIAPSLLLAIALDQVTRDVALLACAIVAARVMYLIFYWANWDKLRSLSWLIGLASSVAIMVKSL